MATRLHGVHPPPDPESPVVIHARSAKTLGAFWASMADYLPGYVNQRGVARLDAPDETLPPMLLVEDPTVEAIGTEGITILADELRADVDALVRVGATAVRIDDDGHTATLRDPEGNAFTVIDRGNEAQR